MIDNSTSLKGAEPNKLTIEWLSAARHAPVPNTLTKYLVYAVNGQTPDYFIARFLTLDGEDTWVIPHGYVVEFYGELPPPLGAQLQ